MIITKKYFEKASSQVSPLLRVSTNYMELPQKLQPVKGGGDIVPYMNREKTFDLYTSGSDDYVFRLKPLQDEYAPYHAENLGILAEQLSLFSTLTGDPDRPCILGLDTNSRLTLSKYQGGKYKQELFEPGAATERLKTFKAVRGATGNIYVTATLEDDTLVNNFFSPSDLKWKSDRWVPMLDPNGATAKVREISTVANNTVPNAMFTIGLEGSKFAGRVMFSEERFAFSGLKDLNAPIVNGKWGKVVHMSVIQDAEKMLNIYAVEGQTGTIWLKRQKKYAAGSGIEFQEWKKIPESGNASFNVFNTRIKSVQACIRFDDLIELYCIAEDGSLHYTHQLADSAGDWEVLFPMGSHYNNTNFNVARNNFGYSEVYSATVDNELIHYIQSPASTQWFTARILVEGLNNEIVGEPAHAVDITVLNENGVPQPNAAVTLSASYQTRIGINGRSYLISAVDPVKISADNTGKLTLFLHATGLASATLYVETAFTEIGEPVVVEPNFQLLHKMKNTTPADVLNAKDRSGKYLLDEKDRTPRNAESIAAIMNSSMDLCENADISPVLFFYRHKGIRATAVNRAPGGWSIDFTSGFPVYESLSHTETLAYAAGVSSAGFLNIDWGDIWDAIKGRANQIIDGLQKILVKIGEKIEVFFEVIVDGVVNTFRSVVEAFQQVFNIVEGVWNWLKVTANRLYEWAAYFFSWADIKRTADAIEYSTNVFLDFTKAAVQELRKGAEQWIDGLKDSLKQSVDDYLSKFGNESTLGTIGEEYKKSNPEYENALDHNPLFAAYKENYKSTVTKSFAKLSNEGPLSELVDKLIAITEEFTNGDGKHAFDEAIAYFSNIKDNPDHALELLFSGLVKVGESIALFALDFGKALILFILDIVISIIDAFKEIMNVEWEIPVVSDLYKYITGTTLSFRPLQLLSYIIAIPSTLIYKIGVGAAPFKDEAELQAFKDYFTLDWMKKRAGLGGTYLLETAEDQKQQTLARNLFKAAYAMCMFTATFADITTAIASSTDTENDVAGYVSTGASVLSAVFTNPWILDVNPGDLLCSSDGSDTGTSTFKFGYIASVLGPLKSAGVMYYKHKNPGLPVPVAVKIDEISTSIVGAVQCILYVVDFVRIENSDPKVFARTMTATIPGKVLRFLSLNELNVGTYFIPVGILGVLIFSGYTAALVINFSVDEVTTTADISMPLAV